MSCGYLKKKPHTHTHTHTHTPTHTHTKKKKKNPNKQKLKTTPRQVFTLSTDSCRINVWMSKPDVRFSTCWGLNREQRGYYNFSSLPSRSDLSRSKTRLHSSHSLAVGLTWVTCVYKNGPRVRHQVVKPGELVATR